MQGISELLKWCRISFISFQKKQRHFPQSNLQQRAGYRQPMGSMENPGDLPAEPIYCDRVGRCDGNKPADLFAFYSMADKAHHIVDVNP